MIEIKYDAVKNHHVAYIDGVEVCRATKASDTAKKLSKYLKGQGK